MSSRVRDFGEVFTPIHVVNAMLDLIPIGALLKNVLEPSCGTGNFIIEIIKRKLALGQSKEEAIKSTFGWDILEDNVEICRNRLIELLGIDLQSEINKNIVHGDFFTRVGAYNPTFEVVIGNPPYQEQSIEQKNRTGFDSAQAKPIYNLFIEECIDNLSPKYLCMIVPSRWMFGGMGLGDFRKRMIHSNKIEVIRDFPFSKDIFPQVSVEGGINYFLWNRDHNGPCVFNGISRCLNEFDIVIRSNVATSVIHKVLNKNLPSLENSVFPNKPFGLATNYSNWSECGIPCYASDRKIYNTQEYLDKYNLLDKWKVATASAHGSPRSKVVIMNMFTIPPGTICTETYIIVKTFDSELECNDFIKYMKSRFFRYLLLAKKVSQHVNKSKFTFVPELPEYKNISDDFLYEFFGLSEDEIVEIEREVRELP